MTDAFVCAARRTPIGRYGGALAGVRADDLAAVPLRALLAAHPGLDPASIDEVMLGCANQAGEDNRNVARMAALLAGLPASVPGVTLNRLCGSGMDAVGSAARAIVTGEATIVLAGGVESMSRAPYVMGKALSPFARGQALEDTTMGWRFVNPAMREAYGVDTMPQTAENVAELRQISREAQDAFALRSQQRAGASTAFFGEEIVAVDVPGDRRGSVVSVARDEQPRPESTLEGLSRLPTPFRSPGTVTAGNASGINDGAGALIVASGQGACDQGLVPQARILGMATAGVAPSVMGLGPVPAVTRLLARLKLTIHDFDVIELNEAFAAQALACLRELGIPDDADHVNRFGGAIALGHPLGMSGARLVQTAVHQLVAHRKQRALVTMCIGVGQGIALALERV
jgi:3-oxoadipyl-CoA thiolase